MKAIIKNIILRAIRSQFFWLNVFLVFINIPMFFNLVLPLYDSMSFYQSYHIFYNELLVKGAMPLWMPYNSYGYESNAYFLYCTPFSQFTMALGSFFNIKNVYLMYKLSVYLEQLLMLLGSYMLCKRLFTRKATVIAVSIIVVGYPSLMHYIAAELYVVSHMPMTIYLFVRYFDTYRPHFLFLAMFLVNISILGVFYLAPLYALECFIIFLCLLIPKIKQWRQFILIGSKDVVVTALLTALMITFSGATYYILSNTKENTVTMVPGRLESGEIIKEYSQVINGQWGFQPIKNYFDPNINREVDMQIHVIYYIGFIPFIFMLYGLVYNRKAISIAFLLNIVILMWMSLGTGYIDVDGNNEVYTNNIRTIMHSFLYDHFPLMKYYRDTPYAWRSITLFLIFLAGFGIDGVLMKIDQETKEIN